MKIKHLISIGALGLTSFAFTGCDTTGINTSGVVNALATGGDKIIMTNTLPITTNEGYTMIFHVPIPQEFFLYDLTYAQAFARRYMELWNEDMVNAGASEDYFFDLENEHQMIHLPENYKRGAERNFRRYNMYNVIKKDAQKYRDGDRRGWEKVKMDPRPSVDKPKPRYDNDDDEWEWRG